MEQITGTLTQDTNFNLLYLPCRTICTLSFPLTSVMFTLPGELNFAVYTILCSCVTITYPYRHVLKPGLDCGLWNVDYGLWTVWTVDCGLWTVDYGLWTVVYGPWTVDCVLVLSEPGRGVEVDSLGTI